MPEFEIGRRELYIIPTRVGWYFSLILLSLFAIAVKYDNQSAFMMLFVLASLSMVAMLYTHNNVIGLSINSMPSRSVFLGETAVFPVQVFNPSDSSRSAIWLVCDGFHQLLDLPAGEHRAVELKLPTLNRGYLNCSPIIITSQFPIGIFFCWTKRFQAKQRCLVYPQPLDITPLPASGEHSSEYQARASVLSNDEDYSGMKPYQAGDRLRDLHWPSLAKTRKLVTIEHEDQNSSSINLSWFALPAHLDIEDKLSQLCFWVTRAQKNGACYQLVMPNHTVAYSSGRNHYHECLSVLALWN
jgi:uncharacterized protein (DUF58 family)